MKTVSLLALIGQVSAAELITGKTTEGTQLAKNVEKVFNWHPVDESCGTNQNSDQYWKVHLGTQQNIKLKEHQIEGAGDYNPVFAEAGGVKYCSFDGRNDYLAVDKLFTKPTQSFTVKSKFRTTHEGENWSLLDCDRSEYFNLALNAQGAVTFATAGENAEGETTNKVNDMTSVQKKLNDGEWHTVTAVFHNGVKTIFIDGWLDAASLKDTAATPYKAVGTVNWQGNPKRNRACFIGDGSEASVVDGPRNWKHFDGDIASVEFYDGKVVVPDNPSFAYYPQVHIDHNGVRTGSCVDQSAYGWPVHVGKSGGSNPKFGGDGNLNYCEFNGVSDYLAIDKRFFNDAVHEFKIRTVFSTTYNGDSNNWALLDCDKSEYFSLSIHGNGKISFSTAGKDEQGEPVPVNNMMSKKKGLNDGNWHEVIVHYHYDGHSKAAMKAMFIDGVEDMKPNGQPNRVFDCNNNGNGNKCRKSIGNDKAKRFCLIGDGSEAGQFDSAQNRVFYDGKIAVVDYVENGDELPGTSPLDCHSEQCKFWDCRQWCECYNEEHEKFYEDAGCVDDGQNECECGWNRHGGYLLDTEE